MGNRTEVFIYENLVCLELFTTVLKLASFLSYLAIEWNLLVLVIVVR